MITKNTIFLLRGDTISDSSVYKNEIKLNSPFSESQIVDDEINGIPIKCIDFNNIGYLSFTLDGSFLVEPFTIEWWEYDNKTRTATSSVFTNMISSATANDSFGIGNTSTSSANCNKLYVAKSGGGYFVQDFKIGNDTFNEWVHRAIVFDGSEYKAYENGKLFGTVTSKNTCSIKHNFQMGRWRSSGGALQKKIYNLKIDKGVLYNDDFTPSVKIDKPKIFSILNTRGVYSIRCLPSFGKINQLEVTIDDKVSEIFEDTSKAIKIDTKSYGLDIGEHTMKLIISFDGTTYTEEVKFRIYSANELQEYATYEEIRTKVNNLAEGCILLRDSLKANLERFGVASEGDTFGELIEKVNDIETNFDFVEHIHGTPIYTEMPSPVLDLDLSKYNTGDNRIEFRNNKYIGHVVGTGFSKATDNLTSTGEGYIDINYAPNEEGAIIFRFNGDENAVNMYGRVFRASSDGVSFYYKKATNLYEAKFYPGGYIQHITPEQVENKRLILTWSYKLGIAKLYGDGIEIGSTAIKPELMIRNYGLYLGDNQQFESGRTPYTIPYNLFEFKIYDCYLDEEMVLEV